MIFRLAFFLRRRQQSICLQSADFRIHTRFRSKRLNHGYRASTLSDEYVFPSLDDFHIARECLIDFSKANGFHHLSLLCSDITT